ncbi:MAG TPA: toll/interleukin-1 receptor domain-containing protein [Thermoanaerobaculia bacterium]|nr:toll/interleukin-1 receptor domain-containing protein [Thermoanaerobaculia bacterium]
MTDAPTKTVNIDVFISHSSHDKLLATQVFDLLCAALALPQDRLRCTSVDGLGLSAGVDTDEQLRTEVLDTPVVIGIISAFSLASAYVLFELGARWGAKKPILPLLAPGTGPQALRGPLARINALSCESPAQLHQLIRDVSIALGIEPQSANVYQRHVDAIVYSAHASDSRSDLRSPVVIPVSIGASLQAAANAPTMLPTGTPAGRPDLTSDNDNYSDAEQIIGRHCEREWPDDYSMRSYCIRQQREAVANLRLGPPEDIPPQVFERMRQKCAHEWPDDFAMRHYAERQQLEGYRQVHDMNAKDTAS